VSGESFAFDKQRSDFRSAGVRCAADLYLPHGIVRPPVVVMAHGFGSVRHFGLPRYAERFAAAGLAVLVFDYRTFGDSDGEPRQLIAPSRHLEDWRAAVSHVRGLQDADPRRIALWGSSYSGGHAIVTAAHDAAIAAIVVQVPFLDPMSSIRKTGLRHLLQATPHGLLDAIRGALGMRPHYVKLVAAPEEFAALNTPDALPGFLSIIDPSARWENKCCARILFTFPMYRPLSYVSKVQCPALVLMAEDDSLVSSELVRKAASRMPKGEFVAFPGGHFELYTGPAFEPAIARQVAFLKRYLAA
jgi:fermentation-respiration switch protein FrsA (DUF1100 family)